MARDADTSRRRNAGSRSPYGTPHTGVHTPLAVSGVAPTAAVTGRPGGRAPRDRGAHAAAEAPLGHRRDRVRDVEGRPRDHARRGVGALGADEAVRRPHLDAGDARPLGEAVDAARPAHAAARTRCRA
jgi:hypothetical protein